MLADLRGVITASSEATLTSFNNMGIIQRKYIRNWKLICRWLPQFNVSFPLPSPVTLFVSFARVKWLS